MNNHRWPAFRPLALLVQLFCLALAGRAAEPTYQDWVTACAKLPMNRALEMRPPPRDLLPLKTFAEVDRVLNAFFSISTNGPMASPSNWVNGAPSAGTFLNVQRAWFMPPEIPFEPFAQKLVFPAGTKVFLEGDLHGDIHSLLAVLNKLNERKLLEGFTIKDPDFRMIFLGDYTDRGLYGVEVIYTLLRLKLANPDRFFMARGNHEDVSLVSRYGFLAEGRSKYGREFDAAKILRAYDFLPVVIYLGNGTDFVQLCHGGMEPGFSPAALLDSGGTNRFQLLGMLKQAAFLKDHPGWLAGDASSSRQVSDYFRDFVPAAPTSPTVLGFMWNDFTIFSDEPAFANNPDRAFVYGKRAVQSLLKTAGGSKAQVHAVMRAHQHSGVLNPIMRRLMISRGLFRHWQENGTGEAKDGSPESIAQKIDTSMNRAIPEGSVWTFNVVPDSVYGAGCGFNFAAFGILTISDKFAGWRIEVENVTPAGL